MTASAIIALCAPVLVFGLRLLANWIEKKWAGAGALQDEMAENSKVITDGNQDNINTLLDDRINGVRH